MRQISVGILLGALISSALATLPEAYYSYLLGLYLAQKGNLVEAVAALNQCREIDPQATYPLRDLALYQWQLGLSSSAEETINLYDQKNPDDVGAQLFVGSFYILTGKPELAKTHLEKVLKLDPANSEAKLYLASIYASSDTSRSIEYLEKYLQENPDDAEVNYQLGRLLEDSDPARAKQLYEKTLNLQPTHLLALLSLAQLIEKSDPEKSLPYYQRYLELNPDDNAVLIYLGGLYYRQKKYPEAKKIFQKSQNNSPKSGLADFWLAMVALEEKNTDEAIEYLKTSLKKEPSYLAMTQLASVYIQKNDYSRAIRTLKKTINYLKKNISLTEDFSRKISSTTYPALITFTSDYYVLTNARLADIYFLLGLAYLDKHQYSASKKSFHQALTLKPNFSDAHFYLATIYDTEKNWENAEKELLLAIQSDSTNATALNYLGYSWTERKKNLARAYEFINQALNLQPENGAYLDSLGWWYYQNGDYSTAEKYLKLAIEKMPDAEILEHLAKNCEKLNNLADAYLYWKKANQLKPQKKYEKEIKRLEKNLLPQTRMRKILKIAEGNNRQIQNFSAIVSLEIPRNPFRTWKTLAFLKYERANLLALEISGPFFLPAGYIYCHADGKIESNLEKSLPASNYSEIIFTLYKFFSSRLTAEFDHPETTISPKGIYYSGSQTLVLSPKNSFILNYKTSDIQIKFSDYQIIDGLFFPRLITIFSGNQKIILRIKKVVINQNE